MNFKIRGKNISITNALREYAESKILKLEKYLDDHPSDVIVNLKVYKKEHKVEVTMPFSSLVLRAEESHHDMYAAIDLVVEKLNKQIQKYKTKANRWKRSNHRTLENTIKSGIKRLVIEEDTSQVVREKRFNLKPMDVEEAVLQMDMLGHNFFVFSDSKEGSTNVVYKRRDGKYGLILAE
jgi:putative sigma-54 modulation protein